MTVHELDRAEARRIAIRAQLLDAPRPTDLLTVVEGLTLLQIDPTAAVAPSADLILWSRLGSSYSPELLTAAIEEDRALVELDAAIRPAADIDLFRPTMALPPRHAGVRQWLEQNARFRRDVIARLREAGPLLSRDIPDTSQVSWPSTGWTNNRNVTQMLEILMMRGEVAIAGRRSRQRLWDLPERVYPPPAVELDTETADRMLGERRLRSLGIVRPNAAGSPAEPLNVAERGEEAVVEGLPGVWRVDPDALGRPFTGRTALLSPFDRLVHDRGRLAELFDFEYTLEMYKPAAQRRWGYFALPILHDDALIGKLDAKADRKKGELVVNAIHEDRPFATETADAVRAELEDLASWLGLRLTGPGLTRRGRR